MSQLDLLMQPSRPFSTFGVHVLTLSLRLTARYIPVTDPYSTLEGFNLLPQS